MHFGHIGVALAAKPIVPKLSFGLILIASTSLDILTGAFFIFGLEKIGSDGSGVFPWSHGLFMASVWAILTVILSYLIVRDLKISIVLGVLVFSHWILDFISHPMGFGKNLPPDIPIFFENSQRVGLGLFNSIPAALLTEFGLLIAGSIFYFRNTKSIGVLGKWVYIFLIIYIVITLIPPILLPKNLVLLSPLLYIPLLPIGIWMDHHRSCN